MTRPSASSPRAPRACLFVTRLLDAHVRASAARGAAVRGAPDRLRVRHVVRRDRERAQPLPRARAPPRRRRPVPVHAVARHTRRAQPRANASAGRGRRRPRRRAASRGSCRRRPASRGCVVSDCDAKDEAWRERAAAHARQLTPARRRRCARLQAVLDTAERRIATPRSAAAAVSSARATAAAACAAAACPGRPPPPPEPPHGKPCARARARAARLSEGYRCSPRGGRLDEAAARAAVGGGGGRRGGGRAWRGGRRRGGAPAVARDVRSEAAGRCRQRRWPRSRARRPRWRRRAPPPTSGRSPPSRRATRRLRSRDTRRRRRGTPKRSRFHPTTREAARQRRRRRVRRRRPLSRGRPPSRGCASGPRRHLPTRGSTWARRTRRFGAPGAAHDAYARAASLAATRSGAVCVGWRSWRASAVPPAGGVARAAPRTHAGASLRAAVHLDLGISRDYREEREGGDGRVSALRRRSRRRRCLEAPYLEAGARQSRSHCGRAGTVTCAASPRSCAPTAARRWLQVDPVASLHFPFRAAELLAVVQTATLSKLASGDRPPPSGAPPGGRDGGADAAYRLRAWAASGCASGFVSSYFRDHNLLRLTRGLFLLHDASSFAFHLFAESEDDHSRIAHDVQAAAASLTRIRGVPTAAALASLRAADLHVAVNLNGHHWNAASESVRLELFDGSSGGGGGGGYSSAAARVTSTYMGYPGPCGASFLQYAHLDRIVTPAAPPVYSRGFTERFALLPHSYYVSDYAASWPQLLQPPPPSADSLPTDDALGARSISCQSSTRSCSRAGSTPSAAPPGWAAAGGGGGGGAAARRGCCASPPPPRATSGGRPRTRARRRARRLLLLSTVAYEAHLRRAAHCDLFVDSRLCNAHTSATDALWAGTPLLTLPGETRPRASPPRSSLPSAYRRSPRRRYALMRTGSSRWRASGGRSGRPAIARG